MPCPPFRHPIVGVTRAHVSALTARRGQLESDLKLSFFIFRQPLHSSVSLLENCSPPLSSPPSSFRNYFPDAYNQHYPNAKTQVLSCQMEPPSLRILVARCFARSLRRKTVPSMLAKISTARFGPPSSNVQFSRSRTVVSRIYTTTSATLYQAVGYKPRNSAKKRLSAVWRAVTNQYLHSSRETGPARHK